MIGLGLSLPEVALRRTAAAEEGGTPANALQLNGQTLQLNGQDLTLGA